MRTILIFAVLLVALPAGATPPPFCAPAIVASTACTTSAQCTAPQHCSCDWNRSIAYKWTACHCIDTTGGISATNALQADLCTLPNPIGNGIGNLYELPGAGKLRIDDPDGDGYGVTVFKRTMIRGNGAVLAVPATHPTFTVLWFAVPLRIETVGWTYEDPATHAQWSEVRDLAIVQDPITAIVNHNVGVMIQAHGVRVNNLRVVRQGTCIDVRGGPQNDWNANSVMSSQIVVSGCFDHGIKISGGNGNGALVSGFEALGVAGTAYWDSGLSTNTIIGALSEGSQTGSFRLDSAFATAVGLYVESGDPNVSCAIGSGLVVGGGGVLNASTVAGGYCERIGANRSYLQFKHNSTSPRVIMGGTLAPIFVQSPDEPYGFTIEKIAGKWGFFHEGGYAPFTWVNHATLVADRARMQIDRTLPESGPVRCCDGLDNDTNGKIDCAQASCNSPPFLVEPCCIVPPP